jgi:hypothetical protein
MELGMTEDQIIKAYFSRIGRKGGSVKGPTKVKTRQHYQKMVAVRWANYRERKKTEAQAIRGV